jgi:hypothetical protein
MKRFLVIVPSGLLHMELLCLCSRKDACYYGRRFFNIDIVMGKCFHIALGFLKIRRVMLCVVMCKI